MMLVWEFIPDKESRFTLVDQEAVGYLDLLVSGNVVK